MISESEASDGTRNTGSERRGSESEPALALATHARQLEAVRAVSEEIARELDLNTLLRLIIDRALGLVHAPAGAICLWDEEKQLLIPQAWVGFGDWMGTLQVRLGEGAGGLAALRRQGVIQNDYQTSPDAQPVIVARTGATAALAEPLIYRDQLLGIIVANHLTPERRFTGEDQHTLRLFVPQAAVAIENARLFRQEQEKIKQLDTVRAVTAEITHELDLAALLRLITQRSIELLGAGSGAVVLWDETAQTLAPAAWHGHGDWYGAIRWRLDEGVLGTVAKRREGLVLNDYRNSPHAHPLFLLRTEITATLAEPLLYRDQLLGVVTVDGYGEGRRFSEQDRQLLNLLASQAAIAIVNARLYANAEEHARELETLREIEQAIASHLDLPAVLEAVVAGAMRLLDNPYAQIILWDEANQALRFGAAQGSEAERVKNLQFKLGRGVNGVVAQTREALILDDYQASPYAEPVSPDVVATISVPILFGDRLLGVLHSHTTAGGRRFTPDDLRRLQMLATQAAFAIENARLHEATQKELADRIRAEEDLKQSEEQARQLAQENATMAEIGRIISSTPKIEEVYQTFANEVQKIIAFDRIVINSINVEKNVVRNLYIAGEGVQERTTSDLYPLEGSGNAEMVRTRASLLIQTEDFQPYADRFPALVSTFQAGYRSILNVPLFAKGQVIGGLLLRSWQVNAYTERDVRLAERISSQIAGAVANVKLYLENARLYEAAQRDIAERLQVERALAVRTRHLETIRSISEEITRELDLMAVLALIVQRAVALVSATSGSIRLWHESQQMLVPVTRTGSERHSATVPLRLGEGVAGAAAEQRRGLIVNNFRTSSYATPTLLQGTTHSAVMATPLLYGERLVGALVITRDEGDPLFAEADLEVLNLFASHAAIAIENARLHETAVQRAQQLATLARVTQSLVALTRAETVGQEVMAAVKALMPEAAARLWDLRGDDLEALEVVASVGLQDTRGGTVRFRRGEGLAGVAADSRQAIVSRDLLKDPRFVNKGWAAQEKLVSAILSPLVVGDTVRGILAVFTREPHDFSETEVSLFQSLATHAAIALENAWLHASTARRNTELEALLRSSKAIGSSLDLDQVLQAIVEQASAISATPIVRLFLLEEDTQLLRCRVAVGFPLEEARALVIPLGASLSGQVALTGEPLAVSDTRGDTRTHYPAHVAQYGVVSFLGLPVKHQDRRFGVLVFNTPAPREYSRDEITFLAAFAQQAALAIQNAQLYQTAVRQGEEREALLRATRSVMAGLDLREILDRIVVEASRIANAPHVKMLLLDKAAQVLRVAAAKGTATAVGYEFPLGASLSGLVAQTGKPLFRADSPADPRNLFAQADRDLGIVTYLGLPIKKGGEVFGVLTINTTAPRQYSPEDLAYLSAFADQAAIAIENARLHETAVQRAHQLRTLNEIARTLAQTLDPVRLVQEIVTAFQVLLPNAAGQLWETVENREELRLSTAVGVGELAEGFRRQLSLREGLAGIVAANRSMEIVADVTKDPRFVNQAWAASEGLASAIGLPLLRGEQILGVLVIFTRTSHTFYGQEIDLLQSFATHAAIAIENARLYEAVRQQSATLEVRVRERTAELEQALQVRAEFLAKMSHELRTPLNFILGFTDLLRQEVAGPLAPKQHHFLDRVHTGGKQLLAMVEDLLELSMVDVAKTGLRLDRISLMPLVQEAIDVFSVPVTQKHLRIEVAVAPDLSLVADSRKLRQILTNLVGNAVKFTPDGGRITVRAGRVPGDCRLPIADCRLKEPGDPNPKLQIENRQSVDWLEIVVEDTGIGIPSADLERIFSGFEQVDGSASRHYGGAGIGLALVRTLVTLHGGTVRAESGGTGKGARFVVRLPSLTPMSTERILVVEDDARVREPLCVFLRDAGYAVEEASTARAALDAIVDRPPDLVVLDIGLPDMDGWEVLRHVREGNRTRTLPVLVLTGLGDENAETAKALGANEFVAKPVSPTVLTGIVRGLLARGAPTGAL